ncbi:MAG TPA: DUF2817 domain-containing protein [Deltaproteobacteria bacterium]|nr:DUF2817 domain-containing protein [Deltaproteobacteria bacterium]
MTSANKIAAITFILFLALYGVHENASRLTALERNDYQRLTGSSEISAFLSLLSHRYASAQKINIATTALGKPVSALLVSSDMDPFKKGEPDADKLTVMLVGSQHGTESSGAEGLLLVARDVLDGTLGSYLDDMNLIFIPNSNPDGRDLKTRRNGNGVDINRNYTRLSEPESRGIINALHRWKPEVVLDVHGAAALKKKTLAKQGYLTDFEAQFEAANNPNVDRRIRDYSFGYLLPQILESVNRNGLPAQRYIKSIKSIHQPVTHGSLSSGNLRNMAGVLGAFSFLLENRIDSPTGTYPTPQNIRVRVSKQYIGITTFLNECLTHRSEIMSISRHARMKWKNSQNKEPLHATFGYAADANKPVIVLPLKRIDTGAPETHTFPYQGTITSGSPLTPPPAYIISSHQDLIRDILARHHVNYKEVKKNSTIGVRIKHIKSRIVENVSDGRRRAKYDFKEHSADYLLRPGDMIVDLNQPTRRLIPLLLEFRSSDSIFNPDNYFSLVEEQKDFFVLPAEQFFHVDRPAPFEAVEMLSSLIL